MLRILLITLLVLHGLIHFMGLGKACNATALKALSRPVGKGGAVAWTLCALLLLSAAALVLGHCTRWWVPALAGALLSQVLIVQHWRDARFGTIANVLILVAAIIGISAGSFRLEHREACDTALANARAIAGHRITESDLGSVPPPVQRFLRKAGVVGTVRPRSMRIQFAGEIRSIDGPWMPFTTTQVNTFDPPVRSFWMDATMKGLPTKGWHNYNDGTATMRIRVLGMISVQDVSGPELDTAETVTWFNDLCLFAPAALIDPRITWTPLDDHRSRATFSHGGITVHAELVFDGENRLVDFISDDRYYIAPEGSMEHRRFRTPSSGHRIINGLLLPGHGDAVWQFAEGPFTYGRFTVRSIVYDR